MTGVHNHSSRFVDYYYVVVLVDDIERDIFGNDFDLTFRVWHDDRYPVEGFDAVVRFYGAAVYEDISVVGYDGFPVVSEDKVTTIAHPFYAIGYRSLNLLQDYYENGKNEQNSHVEIATSLVVRKTLGRVKDFNHKQEKS